MNALRQKREELGLRLEDLAYIIKEETGHSVSPATLSRLERGNWNANPVTRALIARGLRVSPEDLWGSESAVL